MANFGKMRTHKAKEGQRGIRDEVSTLDSSTRRGVSAVDISTQKASERKTLLKDPEIKEKLLDFLFNDGENPLEKVTEKYNKKEENLNTKGYKNIGIVGV